MILITGAAGKTGRAILRALTLSGMRVRAFVRSSKQAEEIRVNNHCQVSIGDLRDVDALSSAIDGIEKVYFICPNMTPDEVEIGRHLLKLAKAHNISQFVYHSVLHPQAEEMPHHWQKMRMEELIFTSGVNFTILQPCAYMQNVTQYWNNMVNEGIYPVPYATSARISMVDLEDVAQVAANVLSKPNHLGAIYELAGPQALSQDEVAEILTHCIGRKIHARPLDRSTWSENARISGMGDYQRDTLMKMFEYYEKHGLIGNSNVLEMLLERPAKTFVEFIRDYIQIEIKGSK